MKPSFLFINAHYPTFLDYFYKNNLNIVGKNYEEQKNILFSRLFGTANFYSLNLINLGYRADDIVANNEILQKQWAKERGIVFDNFTTKGSIKRFSLLRKFVTNIPPLYYLIKENSRKKSWTYQILLTQIKEYKPDILYVLDIGFLSPDFLKEARRFVKIIIGQIASLLPPQRYLREYDLILSSLPHYVERFKDLGINSEYIQLAFEPSILKRLSGDSDYQYEVTHIGGYDTIHNERNEILERVAKEVKVDFWGYGIDNLKKDSAILKNYHGQTWGIDMYNILKSSKITLTKHITSVAQNYANNARLYEATGSGALLLVDDKDNLGKIFKIGKEVITYKDSQDLIDKIKYYLSHEEERQKIARAGQEKTLSSHTYKIRVKKLLNILEDRYKYYDR